METVTGRNVYLPTDLANRLRQLRLERQRRGENVTANDVLVEAIREGLDVIEARALRRASMGLDAGPKKEDAK